jgi:UDP-N-acetylmuramoylalanine--D-glutamate ligase
VRDIDQIIPLGDWLQVPGRHNQRNAAASIAAALSAGASLEHAESGLRTFLGLPHRLQFVIETAGRRFYNDSIATTPESVLMALAAFSGPINLLAGGYDKGIDLAELAAVMAQRVKSAALMGATGPMLKQQLAQHQFQNDRARVCQTLEEAVSWAGEQSAVGDVILLSPGCASYDWFRNFADRGDQFARLAKSWNPRENAKEN